MSSELLSPRECDIIVTDLTLANTHSKEMSVHGWASKQLRREHVQLIRDRENIIAKLQLKAKGAPDAQERR